MRSFDNREYITAIYIEKGIVELIEPDGTIGYYRQVNIQKLPQQIIDEAIKRGELDKNWKSYKEIPQNWSIAFEDQEIQGRALKTFPLYLKFKKLK